MIKRKGLCKLVCLIMTVFMAVCAAAAPAYSVKAAENPAVKFFGVYSPSDKTVSVAVSVKTGGTALHSGMFVIEYDSSYLSSVSGNPTVLGDAISVGKMNDVDNDRVVLEWYYDKALPASERYVNVAQMTFNVKKGRPNDIKDIIWLCTDAVYLDRLGGYGSDGGVLLCYGNSDYSVGKNTVDVIWEMEAPVTVTRLGGSDRFDTASKIAQTGWPNGADNVILASGMSFVDALAGVPLAGALNAPILLVSGNSLSNTVRERLKALSPERVYILGGTSAVKQSVQNAVESMGYSTERISGADRYETAVRIAAKLSSVTGKSNGKAFFAYAFNYPDALAVSSAAALTQTPILYAPSSGSISKSTKNYIGSAKITSAVILGGTSAIGNSTVNSIKDAGVTSVERISGKDRYATSLAIIKKYNGVYTSGDISIATGEAFPDALAGGAMAAKMGIPVILVGKNMDQAGIRSYISAKPYKNVYVFGGTSAVPQKYIDSLTEQ